MSSDIPEGFKLLKRGGGYLTSLGPWYYRSDETKGEKGQLVLAIRIEDRHTNIRHIAHGGFLVTIVDTALGIVVSSSREPAQPIVTVSLTTNFVSSAEPGDWVEAHVDIDRMGGRLAYARCTLRVGERCIMTGTGVFALMKPITPREQPDG
ncbi:MAG: PaaI family thioesterase [Rhodocyclales bacterium]|nr:PaaI family thioesterase [Rhodocyclales bacterium]